MDKQDVVYLLGILFTSQQSVSMWYNIDDKDFARWKKMLVDFFHGSLVYKCLACEVLVFPYSRLLETRWRKKEC